MTKLLGTNEVLSVKVGRALPRLRLTLLCYSAPLATVTSGAYQAPTEAIEEAFSEPSYVAVSETVKQFPATGVLAETSLHSSGPFGANTSFDVKSVPESMFFL